MADIADGQLCIILPVLGKQRDGIPKALQGPGSRCLSIELSTSQKCSQVTRAGYLPCAAVTLSVRQAIIALLQLWLQGLIPA